MSVDDLVTDPNELRAANDAGMRITVTAGSGPRSVTSLAFLAPVIAEIRDLWVNTVNRVADVEVLEGARNLRSLGMGVGSFEGRADLSSLPHLEEFTGLVTRPISSALKNPGLRYLIVSGAIPKSFAQVAGPVQRFEQEGGRSQTELPRFAQPQAMRSIRRVGPARFDLDQLSGMTGLAELEVSLCDEVVGLSQLSRLENLSKVTFKACRTPERWEELPKVPWGFLSEVSPFPSVEFLEEQRAEGWLMPFPAENEPVEALTVDESGDGESWGVYMSRFDDLADAVDLLDGSVPGGMSGEALILGVVAELRSEGAVLDMEPDSEGSFTAVYFRDQAQAEQVFARTRDALAADVATQLRYLRAGR